MREFILSVIVTLCSCTLGILGSEKAIEEACRVHGEFKLLGRSTIECSIKEGE